MIGKGRQTFPFLASIFSAVVCSSCRQFVRCPQSRSKDSVIGLDPSHLLSMNANPALTRMHSKTCICTRVGAHLYRDRCTPTRVGVLVLSSAGWPAALVGLQIDTEPGGCADRRAPRGRSVARSPSWCGEAGTSAGVPGR